MPWRNDEFVFRLGELFCGPGGLSYGASVARMTHLGATYRIESEWANDIDHDSCETFRFNLCRRDPQRVVHQDVRKLDLSKLGAIDGLAFGFPCNDFSAVGEQRGFKGHYGPLYKYGVMALETHAPLWFLAENVSGLRSANEGRAFLTILRAFESAGFGYRITPHLYKFEQYGVPQTRHRIIIVGIRQDANLVFRVPAPTTKDNPLTAWDALCDPPIPHDAKNNERTRQSSTVVERLEHIGEGENAWTKGLPKHLQLNVPRVRMSHIYKRLHPSKPSYTITGSGGGGTHVYHWSEPRALTNRERARIQTFPDFFAFHGSKESVRRQIGMAVPPRGATAIFEAILKTLVGAPYEDIPQNILHENKQLEILEMENG